MTTYRQRLYPDQLEGLPFAIRDLLAALAWAKTHSGVQLQITLDHPHIYEAIEICPPGTSSLRWLIWRTYEGRLRVDDLLKGDFGLPYLTLETALQFIASQI